MKKLLIGLSFLFISIVGQAQRDKEALMLFYEAEEAFENKNYKQSLRDLDRVEKMIGIWSAEISYLRIENYDALIPNKTDFKDENLFKLYTEVNKYLDYMNNQNSKNIPQEKYSRVSSIRRSWESSNIDYYYDEELILAKKHYSNNRNSEAFTLFNRLAENGNPYAMEYIGEIYLLGVSMPIDLKKAEKYLNNARTAGNANANVNLARIILEKENNTTDNYKKAVRLLEEAKANKDERANYWLGVAYIEGWGVDRDMTKAQTYLDLVRSKDKNTPRLEYYGDLLKLESLNNVQQVDMLLSSAHSLPKTEMNQRLKDNKIAIEKAIGKHRSKQVGNTILGVTMGAACAILVTDTFGWFEEINEYGSSFESVMAQYFPLVSFGLISVSSFIKVIRDSGSQEHTQNKRVLKEINKKIEIDISPSASQFHSNMHYGVMLTLNF